MKNQYNSLQQLLKTTNWERWLKNTNQWFLKIWIHIDDVLLIGVPEQVEGAEEVSEGLGVQGEGTEGASQGPRCPQLHA